MEKEQCGALISHAMKVSVNLCHEQHAVLSFGAQSSNAQPVE